MCIRDRNLAGDSDITERVFYAIKDVDHMMTNFLSTGNIKSRGGLDLMQVTGFTIVADKLNYVRYGMIDCCCYSTVVNALSFPCRF